MRHDDTPVVTGSESLLLREPAAALQEPYLNREQAAEYLSHRLSGKITGQQIATWGQRGPRFRLFRGNKTKRGGGWGRWAVYTRADLDAWIETQLRDPFSEERTNGQDHDKLACSG